jgi:hypothetical protein
VGAAAKGSSKRFGKFAIRRCTGCGVRKDQRKYEYQGVAVDAKTLLTQ